MSIRLFPIIGEGAFVPWAFVAPHEAWAKKNHGQTLERLAERGGLSWCELCAVIEHRPWQAMDAYRTHPTKAVARVLNHLNAWIAAITPSSVSETPPPEGIAAAASHAGQAGATSDVSRPAQPQSPNRPKGDPSPTDTTEE